MDFPNLAVLTKSATHEKIQATYAHSSVGNKSLWQNSHHLRLEGYLEALAMVSIDIKHDFTGDGEKIRLLTTEVLLRAAAGELAKSKNIRNWTSMNVVVLPPFLTEIALTDGETAAEAIIKIFAERTNRQEAENVAE